MFCSTCCTHYCCHFCQSTVQADRHWIRRYASALPQRALRSWHYRCLSQLRPWGWHITPARWSWFFSLIRVASFSSDTVAGRAQKQAWWQLFRQAEIQWRQRCSSAWSNERYQCDLAVPIETCGAENWCSEWLSLIRDFGRYARLVLLWYMTSRCVKWEVEGKLKWKAREK